MSDRRLLTTLTLLALAAGLVWSTWWWLKPAASPHEFTGPPRSSYTLRDFILWSYGPHGELGSRLRAPYLQRRDGDNSLYVDTPHFMLPPKQGSKATPWLGKSEYAWVSADGNIIKLRGKVHMHRAAYPHAPAAQLDTADVTIWPQSNKLATAAPAHMRQGTSRMSSVGMRANLNTKYLEMLNDFHGTFEPSSGAKHR